MSQVFVRRCDRCMGVAETLTEESSATETPTVPATVTPVATTPTDGASQPAFSYTLRGKGTTNVQDLCAACLEEIESLLAPGGRAATKPRRGRPRGASVATASSGNGRKRRGRPPGSKNKKRGRPPGSGKKRGRPRKVIEASA